MENIEKESGGMSVEEWQKQQAIAITGIGGEPDETPPPPRKKNDSVPPSREGSVL